MARLFWGTHGLSKLFFFFLPSEERLASLLTSSGPRIVMGDVIKSSSLNNNSRDCNPSLESFLNEMKTLFIYFFLSQRRHASTLHGLRSWTPVDSSGSSTWAESYRNGRFPSSWFPKCRLDCQKKSRWWAIFKYHLFPTDLQTDSLHVKTIYLHPFF